MSPQLHKQIQLNTTTGEIFLYFFSNLEVITGSKWLTLMAFNNMGLISMGVAVRVLAFNLEGRQFKSQPGQFMLE